jgi:hypothetical protein
LEFICRSRRGLEYFDLLEKAASESFFALALQLVVPVPALDFEVKDSNWNGKMK